MFGEVDKRGAAHRRLGTGVRRLNKRVFTPTAVYGSDTDTATRFGFPEPTFPVIFPTAVPTTTSTRNTILLPPTTSTTPILLPTTTTPIAPVTTSTTPSTTSTSTTSSATPTTTSSSVTPTTTQPPTTQAQITQPVQQTTSSRSVADRITDVTQTLTSTRTPNAAAASTSAAPSASSTSDAHPSTSSGVIIGGIIAAVIGVAGILFAVIYFIRRNHKSSGDGEDDDNDFNAQAFRRQSVALRDEDEGPVMSRAMTFNRGGGNPRPPTMIERKMAGTPVSSQNVPPMSHPYGYAASYNQSFAPGQIMAQDPYTPATVNSANPFFSPYGDSPIGTPVSVAPYGSAYESQGQPISRQPTNASSAVLSRQPSSAVQPAPQGMHEGEYVDLSRSSVTPFQAAQYAEISRRLNTAPPQALPASEVAEVAEELAEQDEPVPVVPQKNVEPLELQPSISFAESQRLTVQPTPRENSFPESPFADPTMSMHEEQAQQLSHHDSIRDSFPQPPSPTYSSKSRITSTPPTLPEIQIQQRPFSPVSLEFPIAPSSPHPAPSPLGSSFSAPSPPPSAHFPENVGPAHEPEPAPVSATASASVATPRENFAVGGPAAKRPDTVYTLYDEEDAYAGI